MLRLLFLAALSLKISVAFMPYYEFTIKGNLNCEPVPGKKINVNAIVEAWEADTITSDDFISRTNVSNGKSFTLPFAHVEFGSISPYLIVLHDCNPKVLYERCYARTSYILGNQYQEADSEGIVEVEINLLSSKFNTTIVCGPKSEYPFRSESQLLKWFKGLTDEETTETPQIMPSKNKKSHRIYRRVD